MMQTLGPVALSSPSADSSLFAPDPAAIVIRPLKRCFLYVDGKEN